MLQSNVSDTVWDTHERDSTILTVAAITGGIVGIALVFLLTHRLCERMRAIREYPAPITSPRFFPIPPIPRWLSVFAIDRLSGYFGLAARFARARRGVQEPSSLETDSTLSIMLESRVPASVVSHPGELLEPPPAYVASHHTYPEFAYRSGRGL